MCYCEKECDFNFYMFVKRTASHLPKEIYASVKKPAIIETVRLNRLRWFWHVQRMEENRIP